jgi:hypothetical protein
VKYYKQSGGELFFSDVLEISLLSAYGIFISRVPNFISNEISENDYEMNE